MLAICMVEEMVQRPGLPCAAQAATGTNPIAAAIKADVYLRCIPNPQGYSSGGNLAGPIDCRQLFCGTNSRTPRQLSPCQSALKVDFSQAGLPRNLPLKS